MSMLEKQKELRGLNEKTSTFALGSKINKKENNTRKRVYKRGGKPKYFLFIQERFLDIYVFLIKSHYTPNYSKIKDNFTIKDIIKQDYSEKNIENYLKILAVEKKKNIRFSPNSPVKNEILQFFKYYERTD